MTNNIERWTFDDDALFDLVRAGVKRCTCSLWRAGAKMAYVGDISEIYNSRGETVHIKNIAVRKCRFCDVDAAWVATEGEGDQSLDYWRKVQRSFLQKITPDFQETDYLELEEFIVIRAAKKSKNVFMGVGDGWLIVVICFYIIMTICSKSTIIKLISY